MGQHAQAIREKHTARNVTLIVLAVLVVLLAIAAVFGMQLYKQAKSVKAHESQAISSLSAINDPAKLKDAAASQASIAQAQQLGVVGAKVYQPDTLLLHQVEDVVIIVAFVLASQDEDGWRAHAFQRVPASVHVGCL